MMACPFCNKKIGNKSFKNSYIVCCEHCKYIYSLISPNHLVNTELNKINTSVKIKTIFNIGDKVLCINNNHKMFLKNGFVKSEDEFYVKIDFIDTCMWIDKNTVIKED